MAGLGMKYIYIPVDFDHPTDRDFEDFRVALERIPQATVHVHCIYNARVSAFFYRYARNGFDYPAAAETMESIWRPGHNWAGFIDRPEAKDQLNLYAGEDY